MRGVAIQDSLGINSSFVPCSLFPVHCSLFPVHCSLFPVPCSLFPVPCDALSLSKCSLTTQVNSQNQTGFLYHDQNKIAVMYYKISITLTQR
ncbi:MAG: hypothetical protein ACK57T_16120 [Dolichospermum sp.]